MKPILDLTRAIKNEEYYVNQFTKWGEDKNILFINPQLSGKSLYKMILPFFSMYSERVATAISGLFKYDYEGQIMGSDPIIIEDNMIEWADYIVFPFTTQPLVLEFYNHIKEVKPEAKIVFLVDFNFYELSAKHPFKHIFDEPSVLSSVEDNIWFADICLTSNAELAGYLVEKFKALGQSKYHGTTSYLVIACMPYMIDTDIVLKNIEYNPLKPVLVSNPNEHIPETKKHIQDVEKVAEQMKEDSIRKEQEVVNEQKAQEQKTEETNTEEAEEVIGEPNFNTNETTDNGNTEQPKSESEHKPATKSARSKPAKSKSKSKPKPAAKTKSKPTKRGRK